LALGTFRDSADDSHADLFGARDFWIFEWIVSGLGAVAFTSTAAMLYSSMSCFFKYSNSNFAISSCLAVSIFHRTTGASNIFGHSTVSFLNECHGNLRSASILRTTLFQYPANKDLGVPLANHWLIGELTRLDSERSAFLWGCQRRLVWLKDFMAVYGFSPITLLFPCLRVSGLCSPFYSDSCRRR
jgi:hypothetical protein